MARLRCYFVSDLHGVTARLQALWSAVSIERPDAVFIGGDLLPSMRSWQQPCGPDDCDPIGELFGGSLQALRERLGAAYPRVFAIMGNDDPRVHEPAVQRVADAGLWDYIDQRRVEWEGYGVFGYARVPPTPFLLKDGERYDVSRYVDPGCVSPEEGLRSVPADPHAVRWSTIQRDLDALVGDEDLDRAIWLFHAPPYDTGLDRAALDGRTVDHAPLDVHVGSVAVRRMIDARQPLLTLHGHIHESARITGVWRQRLGRTLALSAAHDGPELALVRFELPDVSTAARELLAVSARGTPSRGGAGAGDVSGLQRRRPDPAPVPPEPGGAPDP